MADVLLPPPGHDQSGAPPVTICSAAADEAAVRQAAEALEARGHEVQLAIGVDADPTVLTNAVAARHGQGLYVLCRSPMLDRASVDGLREVLRAHDVPFGRTLTLAIDPQRARELEERIVSVLRRMVTGRADNRARSWGSSVPAADDDPETMVRQSGPQETVDPMAALAGLGIPPENADPHASTSQIELVEDNATGLPPPYTAAEHTAVGTQAAAAATMPGVDASASAPITIPGSLDAEPVSSDASSAPVVAPSMPGTVDPLTSFNQAGMNPAHMMGGPRPDESLSNFEPPLTFGGRIGRALGSPRGLAAVLGSLAVIVLVGVLIVSLSGDDDDDQTAAKTETKDEPADEAKKDGANDNGDSAEGAAGGESEAAGDADSANGAANRPVRKSTNPVVPKASELRIPPDARVAAPSDDPPEVTQALRDREVRALDIFLIAPEKKGNLTYQQAEDYCAELEVAGLGQWRVPSIGELNAVGKARMLGKNIYWSSTFGDAFGDDMLVLNTKKDRISSIAATWDGGRIVCIRPRRP